MYNIDINMSPQEAEKYTLLNRIERLEQANDRYVASHGYHNAGLYDEIQALYNKIDDINRKMKNKQMNLTM